ncbi:hypothetical protein SAE02_65860 [Skermanella aerolata]|uniref:Uncharacterized protein n=2 Tax=Skermanella aerolata TaxID=393310 RepID=A0A512E127_9PROT|nr:hypothetical protein SAE02_65860 [Skermanella aerolata]
MKHWMIWTAGLSVAFGIAAAPVAAADKVASRPAVSKPANPTEDWSITAVNKDSGGFDYCAAGTRFDNGHALLIARNKAGEVIVLVGLASDKLKTKSVLPTRLTIDGKETRQSSGLVTRPSAMAITMGKDQGFFESLRRGSTLAVDNPELKITVNLRGSGRALADLTTCVDSDGGSVAKVQPAAAPPILPLATPAPASAPTPAQTPAPTPAPMMSATPEPAADPVPPAAEIEILPDPSLAPMQLAALPRTAAPLPAESAATPAPVPAPSAAPAVNPIIGPALPDALVSLLSAAGMAGIVPVSMERVAPDQRPATFAWKYGPVFGGIREISIIDNRSLVELTDSYVDVLRNSCSGKFSSSLGPVENLREITLRTGEAACATPDRTTEFRHLYYINKARIFTTFIHESDSTGKAMAVTARDQLAAVIRQLATAGTVTR